MKVLIAFCLCLGSAFALLDYERSCTEKPERGMCLGYMPKYYYDPKTDTCKEFIYGGCQGNGNRYASEQECLDNCKKGSQRATDDVCSLKPETGPCRALFHKYYYDANTGECSRFIYGGCSGNGNRFDTEAQCYNACSRQRSILPDCRSEPEVGLCKAAITRYYFDRHTGECKEFIYGGCGGNKNNYPSRQICEISCLRV